MRPWWSGAVGYEVYVRSFADSDGDGVGDLEGVRLRLPYLADLGVDLLWLTPFYPSPQADHGYDITDHTDVDPVFGDLDVLERLISEAHAQGLRVLVDLVPNHTSDRHPWFVDARSGPSARYRNRYVWREGGPDGQPPNNWVSHFGGPAWTYDPPSGEWYMHLFLPEQPDLNWADEGVRDDFDEILRTWLERGVDGFRIDVAHSLVEHPGYPDNPTRATPRPGATPQEVFDAYDHLHDLDQPGVLDIYRRWRTITATYDALLVGEVYLLDPDRVARYIRDGDGLDLAFCFPVLKVGWDADEIRTTIRRCVDAGGDAFAWPLSSHDDPRAATRFGGGRRGTRRALAYATLLCGLPGVPFLYQGDELGLEDAAVRAATDPIALRNPGASGRDACRTPMLWKPGGGYGFTTGTPWLDFGDDRDEHHTVAVQAADPHSPLACTRAMLRTRRELADLRHGPVPEWSTVEGPIVAYRRGAVLVALHAGGGTASLDLGRPGAWVAHGSVPDVRVDGARLELPSDSAAYVVLPEHAGTEDRAHEGTA